MKRLFTLILAAVLALPAFATHLMGGEITAKHLGGFDYEVYLTTYRDTLGIPMQTSAFFDVSDTSGTVLSFTTNYDTTLSGGLLALSAYGVEVYHFIDTVTMPGPGQYTISWSNCCRNGAIINASTPLSESMFLYTNLTVMDTASAPNSTPVFLMEPVVAMDVMVPWTYNPLPFDADGDSLVWSLAKPWDSYGSPIDGFYIPPGDSTGPFVIDSLTGTISWTPAMEGNFVATIKVDEYRGGVHIGTIIRDMQMIVINSPDIMPKFANADDLPTNADGYPFLSFPAGEEFTLTLMAEDPDLGQTLTMIANGEPFLQDFSPAMFDFAPTGVNNNIEGVFTWTPTLDDVRQKPYIVVFRLDDGIFATDLAILMRVGGATAIEEPVWMETALFPNPSSEYLTLRFNLDQSIDAQVRLIDASGRVVRDMGANSYTAGLNQLMIRHSLDNGTYYLVLEGPNGPLAVRPFQVAR